MAPHAEDDGTVEEPLNREPTPKDLVNNFLTPTGEAQYDRNHGPILHLSAKTHVVTIDGLVDKTLKLSSSDLATNYPQHKVICALQCAGNRRHAMRTRLTEVQGIDWFDAAILNAEWEGPLLKDVLTEAGPKSSNTDLHVAFACHQTKVQEDDWYGGSIPLKRAMEKENEVVLALKMNGEPLTPKHGFPVRAVVPGVIGARSVKWLDTITVADSESPNYYMQHDYKVLPPDAKDKDSAAPYWGQTPPMMDNCINSVVAIPEDDENIARREDGTIGLRGYAVPQADNGPVVRVEVSVDEGKTWVDARLGPASRYSWVLWEADVQVEKCKGLRIFSKATDAGGNTQTMERSQWNLRGVGYNGYESTTGVNVI